ncbi:Type II secretion system (T2SS), protein F [Candidatus Gugararchaeum adminiculabundum]|nr:Type II secretion system (T2SS), protein F [Candidatus Gugararchaeum adminiculabundum]
MIEKIFVTTGDLFPDKIVKRIERLAMQADLQLPAKHFIGVAFWCSLVISIAIFVVSGRLIVIPQTISLGNVFLDVETVLLLEKILIIAITMLISFGIFFMFLLKAAEDRARKIDEVLPDAMEMISANMRAGMTFERAILTSAKPEFGPFGDEVKRVSSKSFGGMPFANALNEMADRVKSASFARAIKLLVEGDALGGEMAELLNEVSKEIQNMNALKREIANATMMYVVLITFSSLIAAPALFAVSVFYSGVSAELASQTGGADLGDTPVGVGSGGLSGDILKGVGKGKPPLTGSEMELFALVSLGVTALFSALIINQIRDGTLTRNAKMIPIFMVITIVVYFVAKNALAGMFAGILVR